MQRRAGLDSRYSRGGGTGSGEGCKQEGRQVSGEREPRWGGGSWASAAEPAGRAGEGPHAVLERCADAVPPEQQPGPSTNTASKSSSEEALPARGRRGGAGARGSGAAAARSPACPNSSAPMAKPPQTARMMPMLKVITTSMRAAGARGGPGSNVGRMRLNASDEAPAVGNAARPPCQAQASVQAGAHNTSRGASTVVQCHNAVPRGGSP